MKIARKAASTKAFRVVVSIARDIGFDKRKCIPTNKWLKCKATQLQPQQKCLSYSNPLLWQETKTLKYLHYTEAAVEAWLSPPVPILAIVVLQVPVRITLETISVEWVMVQGSV